MQGFGGDNPKIQALQARADPNTYIQFWRVGLCKAPCERPCYCCYAMWCAQCASCSLRQQALYGDMTRYTCCNGACPCSGRCGESKCPTCCLCLEVFCCFSMSVAATRYMIQDELRIQTSACDNCIIGTMVVLEYIACVCHIIACITGSEEIRAAANIIQLVADLVWCSVCACMQTQHKVELDERDKNPHAVRPGQAPGVQMIPMGGAPGAYPPPPVPAYQPAPYPPPPQGYAPYPGYAPQQGGYPYPGQPQLYAGAPPAYPPQHYPQQYPPPMPQYAPPPPGYVHVQPPAAYPNQQMYR